MVFPRPISRADVERECEWSRLSERESIPGQFTCGDNTARLFSHISVLIFILIQTIVTVLLALVLCKRLAKILWCAA